MTGPMPQTESEITEGRATSRAGVTINGMPISRQVDGRLRRVLVDNDVHLPGMFELTFLDFDGSTLGIAGITMGSTVTITGGVGAPLITGEVTAIEGILDGQRRYTIIRGYTGAHRLQRARRSRTFLNTTDADIAAQIAMAARLPVGEIVPTTTIHGYLAQVNQTDWEFLRSRAEEIGYRVGVSDGLFFFRPVLGIGATVGVTVTFPQNLISFRPRVTAANLTPDVEVRVWDPLQMQAFAEQATLPAAGRISPSVLGAQFGEGGVAGAVAGTAGSDLSTVVSDVAPEIDETLGATVAAVGGPLGTLGPVPSPTAYVVNDRPVAAGLEITTAGQSMADALGGDLGGTYAEAEGDAFGNPLIQPGAHVTVVGTQFPFDGSWLVSHARHVFDDEEHGYRTTFAAHGRQDRSMLGLTSLGRGGGRRQHRATLDGLVCGVVSNVLDPLGRARVKVTLPWLSPDFETDWAPVGQGCVGPGGGLLYLPNVGDEVVLAFEYGDPRRPYVLGSLVNNFTSWTLQTGAGPGAAMASLAGGLGGMGGQLASAAGSLESLAGDIASLTVAGQLLNATGMAPSSLSGSPTSIGSDALNTVGDLYGLSTVGQAANLVGVPPPVGGDSAPGMSGVGDIGEAAAALAGLGAVQESPGMVGEVIRRGYVSSTGNVLVFDDQPLTPVGGAAPGGEFGALTQDVEGEAATPALASSITLGSQNGTHGLYVDQVAAMVLLQSNATPGVSMSETPILVISAGQTGSVIINAGTDVTIASEKALTMMAPEIMLAGETVTVVGELIPLTPG